MYWMQRIRMRQHMHSMELCALFGQRNNISSEVPYTSLQKKMITKYNITH